MHRGSADLAIQDFMGNRFRSESMGETIERSLLLCNRRAFRLGEEEVAQPIDIPAWPAVARAVYESEGIGQLRVHQAGAQFDSRVRVEIHGCPKSNPQRGGGVLQSDLSRVQTNAWVIPATVKCVPQDWESGLRRVYPNLVGASRQRFGFQLHTWT